MYIWNCFHCSYKRSLDVILKVYLLKNGSSIQKSSHTFSESQMKLQLELIVELCQTFLYYFFDQSNSITNYYQECKGVLLKWEIFFKMWGHFEFNKYMNEQMKFCPEYSICEKNGPIIFVIVLHALNLQKCLFLFAISYIFWSHLF